MPDYIHVDYPDSKILRESMKTATESQESLAIVDNAQDYHLATVLSGHHGWVTVDRESLDRKRAAETFQSTNPIQSNKMRPAWMELNTMTHSMDVTRYKKYMIDLSSKSHISQRSVFNLKKEKDLDQLTSGMIGKNIIPKVEDISVRDDFEST